MPRIIGSKKEELTEHRTTHILSLVSTSLFLTPVFSSDVKLIPFPLCDKNVLR
jgi:hypothetical protein